MRAALADVALSVLGILGVSVEEFVGTDMSTVHITTRQPRGTKSHSTLTPMQQPELSHRQTMKRRMILIKLMYARCSSFLISSQTGGGTPVDASTSGWLVQSLNQNRFDGALY